MLCATAETARASVSVTLRWTAPGDDGVAGRASAYQLRYSLSPITPTNFAQATVVPGLPAPLPAGQTESFTVAGLPQGPLVYFALKTRDEASNWSGMSNVAVLSGTSVDVGDLPITFALGPSYPNPAPRVASFRLAIPSPGAFDFEIFDVTGRRVHHAPAVWTEAGYTTIQWDLRGTDGRRVAPGLYLVRARYGGIESRSRLIVK
jgi:hypothetical protein